MWMSDVFGVVSALTGEWYVRRDSLEFAFRMSQVNKHLAGCAR